MTSDQPLILHAFSTFKLGGPQARFVQLANALGPRFKHLIVAMDGCFEAGDRLDPRVSWKPLPLENRRGGALANRRSFRKVLQETQPDLVLTYNWGAIEWVAGNWPRCVPHVHVEDGFGPEEVQSQLPRRVWTRRVLLALRRTPTIVASRHLWGIATSHWWLPTSLVCFIPNGVDVAGLIAAREARGRQLGDELVVGTVAGLRPEKNIARLIRAFAVLRSRQAARLVVVGDGPERAGLAVLAAELGIASSVEFAGYLRNPVSRLVDFDLFALSSDTEQLPISMLEAMAAGIPVVATTVGDVARIIPAVAQVALSEPEDKAFEEALLRAVDHRDSWPVWSAAGQNVVQREYDTNDMVDHWHGIFAGNWKSTFSDLHQAGTR